MKIALASVPIPNNLKHGLDLLNQYCAQASQSNAKIICFPESFLPGYPGMPYPIEDRSEIKLIEALKTAQEIAKKHQIAILLPMDWYIENEIYNVVQVIDANGDILGFQTKNQLDPSEDTIWKAGKNRKIFKIDQLTFGISICHEGFRYPETVRWAARNGAQIVFHPHFAGNLELKENSIQLQQFGTFENPYYERAMQMRSIENAIYFASINYTSSNQESASAVFNPDGSLLKYQEYRQEGNLIVEIDLDLAKAHLAKRLKPECLI